MKLYFIKFTDEENEGYYYKHRELKNSNYTIITCKDLQDAYITSVKSAAVSIAKSLIEKYDAECIVEAYYCELEEVIEIFD